MADEKKHGVAADTVSASTVTPVFADERGYHEKDAGYAGGEGHIHIGAVDPNSTDGYVQRNLQPRHLAMIALGGAIGTGLFVGSGQSLASGGPVGLWLGYIFMSTIVWSMMIALGEMCSLFPVAGGFTHYATRFVDPAMGFALGVNYWYSYAITLPTELVAASIVISYWNDTINAGAWIAILLVAVVAINFFGVRWYGEAEFWFSLIKIVTIVGLIILGIILDAGGGPNHDAIGFRYWRNPGPFNQIPLGTQSGEAGSVPGSWGRFLSFWSVFVQAAFSFLGTEIIAVTVGEAANPRKTVPKAIKTVFIRIVFFYVFGIWVISVLVPYNDPRLLSPNGGSGTATASPFVIAIQDAGIKGLPSVLNAVFLISAWSAGNSDLYASSRTLYALALEGKMPAVIRKCTKGGLPWVALTITAAFGLLAFMTISDGTSSLVFNWLYNITSITGLITWGVILGSYLRFYYGLKRQGITRDDFPYRAPFQPYLSWYGFVFVVIIILFNGFTVFLRGNWNISNFFTAYITLPIFALCYFGWKIFKKTKWISLDEMDLITGRREFDEMEENDKLMDAEKKPSFLRKLINIPI